jgi:hypothetical protein
MGFHFNVQAFERKVAKCKLACAEYESKDHCGKKTHCTSSFLASG